MYVMNNMDEKNLLATLETVEKSLKNKTALIYAIGQEILTCMEPLLEAKDKALECGNLDEESRDCLKIIEKNVFHLTELAKDMTFSASPEPCMEKIEKKRYDTFFLTNGILDEAEKSALKKHIHFSFKTSDFIPQALSGDSGKIRQCVRLILMHVIFCTDEGEVIFSMKSKKMDENKILLEIKAAGKGMCRIQKKSPGLDLAERLLSVMGAGLEFLQKSDGEFEFGFCLEQDVADWGTVKNVAEITDKSQGGGSSDFDFMEKLSLIEEISPDAALKNCGNLPLLKSTLKSYYSSISKSQQEMQETFAAKDWKNYCIKAHSLKSTSRLIGALSLSQKAAGLESAAERGDEKEIAKIHASFMEDYLSLEKKLSIIMVKNEESKPVISESDFEKKASEILALAESFNLNRLDEVVAELSGFSIPESKSGLFEKICGYVENVDFPELKKLLAER